VEGSSQDAYDYTRKTYPDGSTIRRDDVAEALIPVLEVHPKLRAFLKSEKIRGKHWIEDFCDYVLEKTWDEIQPTKELG
jgi:hypothetical protein